MALVRSGRLRESDIDARFMPAPSLPAAQARLARGLDPVVAPWRGGNKDAVMTAESALEVRAREQGAQFRVAAGGIEAEAIERAGDRGAIDQFLARIAEPAGELEARLLVAAGKSQAGPLARRCPVGECLDADRTELGVDGCQEGRRREAQLGNACGDF